MVRMSSDIIQRVPGFLVCFALSSRSDFVFASDLENPLSGFFFLPSKK